MYRIRKARMKDLPQILEIYSYARDFMARNGNPSQWGKTNPPEALLRQDIAQEKLYAVCTEDEIHGVFFFAVGDDPTYAVIEKGRWLLDTPYGTIHRIASKGSGGILKACVSFCAGICPHLRIDTHEDNRIMQRTVEKLGFHRCGIIYVSDGSPRIAYERVAE